MNRIRAIIALIVALAVLACMITGDWRFALAVIGVTIAVGAEIGISMHRHDHERRHRARREGDPQ